jgi:hypothetical protein
MYYLAITAYLSLEASTLARISVCIEEENKEVG